MVEEERRYLGVVDYIIFGLTLLLSIVIGIFFACKQKKSASTAEYLVANRSVSWFPIFISLVVSFFSPVGVMGTTALVYSTGVTFSLHAFAFLIPISLNAYVFAPIFRRLKLISVNKVRENDLQTFLCLYNRHFLTLAKLI